MTNRNDKLHLPSPALLRSFECAARHQSFTRAAEELHISQSAFLPEYLIEDELNEGKLILLNDVMFSSFNSYFLVKPKGSTNQHVEIFEQWIKSMVRD